MAYNSSTGVGQLREFASHGIVYDRNGPLEVRAGETPSSDAGLRRGLAVSLGAGMIPDIEIQLAAGPLGCTRDPNATTLCLPVSAADIAEYVRGFIATATSIRRLYPGRQILFEPMNEPWSWGSPPGIAPGRQTASEYAAVLARLLPAAAAAGIPLTDIYVSADGVLADGSQWVADLYRAQPCLRSSCGPIEGWNLHPYGPPGSSLTGIDSAPGVRSQMLTGRDNVIVSEIGFCSLNAYGGRNCDQNTPTVVGWTAQVSDWMSRTLAQALRMHQAGWLRALIVWNRGGAGWSMQNADGTLTPQGQILVRFADAHAGAPASSGGG